MPQVVEAILSIQDQSTHIAVKHTSLMLLGELCEWVERHPNTLDPILHYLVSYLAQPNLGPAAAEALQNICTTCGNHMAKHMPFLLQILHEIDKFDISNDAVMGEFRK